MRYEYRGPNAPKAPVEVTAGELARLKAAAGGVTSQALFEASKHETAPLHEEFEWDPAKAVAELGVIRAGEIIRSVVLVPEPEKHDAILPPIRAWVSVADPSGPNVNSRIYKPVIEVLEDEQERAQVKRSFLAAVLALRQKYMNLIEYDETIHAQVDALVSVAK